MRTELFHSSRKFFLSLVGAALVSACASPRGTGDLGIIVERATGSVQVIETSHHTRLAQVTGLGDLSHASAVYSRDARYAYVFGRDGGLTKVDLLRGRIDKRDFAGRSPDRGFQ
jgi:protein NirF